MTRVDERIKLLALLCACTISIYLLVSSAFMTSDIQIQILQNVDTIMELRLGDL